MKLSSTVQIPPVLQKNRVHLTLLLLAAMGVSAIHVMLGLGPIRTFSPTYDEPVHLTAGLVAWKTGETRFNGYDHPPFGEMWAAIPLIFLNPIIPKNDPRWTAQRWRSIDQYRFADLFFYHNRVPADAMLAAARKMQLLLSVLLGFFLVWVAFRMGGLIPALVTLVLWGFSPTFLTHGTIVSTDLAFACFFFSFFVFLSGLTRGWGTVVGSGISLGLCVASKYLAVAVFPCLAAVLFWDVVVQKKTFRKINYLYAVVVCLVAFLTVKSVFQWGSMDVFWDGLKNVFTRSQAGRSSFFAGRHGVNGWFLYFPFTFLVKTPIPLLTGCVVGIVLMMRKKISVPAALWIPPLVYFLLACISKVQIGHRHILAIYPFVIVLAGLGFGAITGRLKWLVPCFLLWNAAGTILVRPHFIAYFNEFVGGPKNGYRYLTDSNVDWGQGLKLLRRELSDEDVSRGIYLSYFGVADPHAEGITYLDVGSDVIAGHRDDTGNPSVKPTTLAISITNLQGTYFEDKDAFRWLSEFKPIRVVGESIFVYDFSNQPGALEALESMRRPS